MKEIKIYIDEKGDRNCPSCKAAKECLHFKPPKLIHERTEMSLTGHCSGCGCDFRFLYTLFVSDADVIHRH